MIFLIDKANLLRFREATALSRSNKGFFHSPYVAGKGIQEAGNSSRHCKTNLNFRVCDSAIELHSPILNTSMKAGKSSAMPLSWSCFTCADNSSPQTAFFPDQLMVQITGALKKCYGLKLPNRNVDQQRHNAFQTVNDNLNSKQ